MREQLARIQWAARQVIGAALESASTDVSTLKRLQASVARQASAARDLRQQLITESR